MGEFNVIIEKDEEGYFVSEVIGLPGCHTQARTIDELIRRTKEAIALYLKSMAIEGIVAERFIGIKKIEV